MNQQNADIQVLEVPVKHKPELSGLLAHAEIDSQIATAKAYPRDIEQFRQKLLGLAEKVPDECFYQVPRQGKDIEGPSVRLAELAISCFKNIIAQGEISHADDKSVYGVGMCRDLENNTAVRRVSWRRITDRRGNRFSDDMVFVTGNAVASIAFRDAVFSIIPRCFIDPVWKHCKKLASGKTDKLSENRKRAIEAFAEFGIDKSRILERLERKSIEDVTRDDLIKLQGFITAIREQLVEVSTIFPVNDERPVEPQEVEQPKKDKKKTAKRKGRKGTNLF